MEINEKVERQEVQGTAGQPPASGVEQPYAPDNGAPAQGGWQPDNKAIVKRTASRIGFGIAAMILLQQVMGAVLAVALTTAIPGVYNSSWYMWVVAYVPLYFVGFPVFWLIVKSLPNYTGGPLLPRDPTAGEFIRLILASVGIVYTFNFLSYAISSLMEQLFGSGISNPLAEMAGASNSWLTIAMTCIVAPVMEELIFRELLYKKLIGFGGKVYVLFSAVVFGLMHPNFYQLIYAFLLGLMFGALRYYTGKLRWSILLHFIINFIGSGVSTLLTNFFDESILVGWSYIIIVAMLAGLVIVIHWLVRQRRQMVFEPGPIAVYKKSWLFANAGMVAYIAMMLLLILSTLIVA